MRVNKLFVALAFLVFLSNGALAAGGYASWQYSADGSDVACGSQYSSWQQSADGSSVCAGGQYTSWQYSADGSDVAAQWSGD